MQSKVHPTYKTKYRVANWVAYNQALVRRGDGTVWLSSEAIAAWIPVRLEFPILSLHPGLRPRCVAPDVWGRRVAGGGAAALVEEAGRHAVRQRRMAMPLRWKTSRLLGSRRANAATNRQSAANRALISRLLGVKALFR